MPSSDYPNLVNKHAPKIELSALEEETLRRWARTQRGPKALALRAEIVLASAKGLENKDIALMVKACPHTVGRWRRRFFVARLDGLVDEPRSGAPRKISDERVEQVIQATLEQTPPNATHWSTREMARKTGLSQSTISRVWRAFGLQPHRSEEFALTNDPLFVEKVRDIVGIYLRPPVHAMVLCVDEKSQIQALERTQPLLPMRPGQVERRTCDYDRHGTTTLFAALDVATGQVLGQCYTRHRTTEFLKFLRHVDANVPKDLELHLVLDNYATHKTAPVKRWLAKRPRYHLHFTPTHASWLNQVERWFGLLTQRQIKRGSHQNVRQLIEAIESFIQQTNEHPKPFTWVKDADEILHSIARFAQRTLEAHADVKNF